MFSIDQLAEVGGVLDGHFVLTSGMHSARYYNMDPLYTDPEAVSSLGEVLWNSIAANCEKMPQLVVAPAVGEIPLGFATALAGGVEFVWADKTEDGLAFSRQGFADLVCDNRVLLIVDVVSTGSTLHQLYSITRRIHGEIVGLACVIAYSRGFAMGLPIPAPYSHYVSETPVYGVASCKLCASHVPINTSVAHGAEYAAIRPGYPGGFVS